MNKTPEAVKLPLARTVYQTFTFQGAASAIIYDNPSIRNWYLNERIMLSCNRSFFKGNYSTPEILIDRTYPYDCPYLEIKKVSAEFLGTNIHSVIRNALKAGFYIYFDYIDDYYIKGKSWYHQWHFSHDGLIFGYDSKDQTYDLLSYDKNWLFRPYKTPQRALGKGVLSNADTGIYSLLYLMKPKDIVIETNPRKILKSINAYLDSSMIKYPPKEEENALGIVVLEYLTIYLDCLYNEFYPHERIDRRSFRMVWEHKTVMLECLQAVENKLGFDCIISTEYQNIVREANNLRMIYASYCMKPRKPLLLQMKKKLMCIKQTEEELLHTFTNKLEIAVKNKG